MKSTTSYHGWKEVYIQEFYAMVWANKWVMTRPDTIRHTAAAKAECWAMPTWCHMFNSTFTKNTRVWFDDHPKESIDSYDDLKEAFLENYLQQKKCIKDPVEIHNIKQRDGESIEEFIRSRTEAKLQEGRLPKPTKAEAKAGQIHPPQKNTQKKLWLWTKGSYPSPMTTPVEKRNAGKFCEFHGEVGHATDDWEEDGTEGPMIIEAEMSGHFVHRMSVDGGSFSKILANIAAWEDRRRGTFNVRMDELHGCKVTIFIQRNHWKARSNENLGSSIYNSWNAKPIIDQVTKEKIQVAIHPQYPEQTIAIGSTLTEEGRKELYGLLRRNLDIFTWKPVDIIGVSCHIVEHMLDIREGCLPVRQKKRGRNLKEIRQSMKKWKS
uniref:Reverse transcriptase domain-containing protein n=1 Tax=Tanacetum cinerariifolium TaxID=118510 RepID=A0A6L2J7M6_TANCI|nr:reverse transcriptase domain-containing protein [Tanacetum cinerariifolium]